MPTATAAEPKTLAGLLRSLGGVSPRRVLWKPTPGTATEADYRACGVKLVELYDGTLVEKAMGQRESFVAANIVLFLNLWRLQGNGGTAGGPDGEFRLAPGLIRRPDASYTAWASLPNDTAHLQPVGDYPPDLAVEVLSESNRPGEMKRKVKEYFDHGTQVVWVVDPRAQTITVYSAVDNSTTLTRTDTLGGGDLMPGFTLPLAQLFDDPQLNPRPKPGA